MGIIKGSFLIIFKSILKVLVIFIFAFFSVLILFWFFPIGNELAKDVNQRKIASLKLGMTKNEVIQVLGIPLSQRDRVLVYGKSGFLTGTDMKIIFKNNQLDLVYIGFWDASFYYCDKDVCRAGEPFYYNWFIPK